MVPIGGDSMITELFITVISAVAILLALSYFVQPIHNRLYSSGDRNLEIDQMRNEIASLSAKLEYETQERVKVLNQLAIAYRRIEELEKKERENQKIIATLRAQIGDLDRSEIIVLGVWSGTDLDIQKERNAIYDAGFRYRALIGTDATQGKIMKELRKGDISVLEIGSHGSADALLINQKHLGAGWWLRALRGRGVRVAVILACFSDDSVAEAIKQAGVEYVISVRGQIEDSAAIEFAKQFYQLYALGLPVDKAFDEAKLAIDYRQGEKLLLR